MWKPSAPDTRDALLCPSSQPWVQGARVLGVVEKTPNGTDVNYLDEPLPATPDVLALAGPFPPAEVFRLAAPCQTHSCPHFDGADCGLATRIVQILPAVVDALPRCQIRPECRWFRQEGAAACRRCPAISTLNYDASEMMQRVVQLPPAAAVAEPPTLR